MFGDYHIFLHNPFVMREPIKLFARGNKTDKIAPPDLDCIFFSFYKVVSFFQSYLF